ncbi:MAG: LysR family transcriptional regulator [Neisseriaceae bacterium]|nr:LysR family transcriptional regulator [Neisseriaceae bacterium]
MDDLTDFYYFVVVVRQGSFAAAGRALNVSTAKVSRRMALLEERHNVRLIQRSTRSFEVTEIGMAFYERCVDMLAEAEAAQRILQAGQEEAQGGLRISIPAALMLFPFQPILHRFMQAYPKVRLYAEMSHRRINVIDEHFDLSIRVRTPPFADSGLVVKSLAAIPQVLVAAPTLLAQHDPIQSLADLATLPSLGLGELQRHHDWTMVAADGSISKQRHQPVFMANDVSALVAAALAGCGVVQLPQMYVHTALKKGDLVAVMSGYGSIPAGVLQAAYPTRQGMLPIMRALLDLFEEEIQALIQQDIGLVDASAATF